MVDIAKAAAALMAARRTRTQIPPLSAELAPTNVEDAYAIQNESMHLLGPVAGWKTIVTGDFRCSPIPAATIFSTPAKIAADPRYKIEVEIGIMIGRDVEGRQTADTIRDAIASVHPAIEIVLSRFAGTVPMEQGLADCQSCEAMIIGPAFAGGTKPAPAKAQMALLIDGQSAAANLEDTSIDTMLPGLAWLANQAQARGLPLRKGHFIITGARLKTPAPPKPCRVTVVSDGQQVMTLELA